MSFKADAPIFAQSGDLPPEALDGLRRMIGQLPIVWALREGGEVRVKIADVYATGDWVLAMEVDHRANGGAEFVFRATRKS